MKINLMITVSFLVIGIIAVKAQTKSREMKNIDIAGLIVNSETMKPIEGAKIFDGNGKNLGVTNSDGYFKVKMNCIEKEEIDFQLKVEKENYTSFLQQEHWGGGANQGVYYFGLKHLQSNHDSFSEMMTNISDISYASVNQNFEGVKAEIFLEERIENAKKGNDIVFFEIDNGFYIVNESGWIKLKAKEENISINDEKVVSAFQLNSLIKRQKIKGMTPIVSETASVRISTF